MAGSRKGAVLRVGQEEHNYLFTYIHTYTELLSLTHVGERETTTQATVPLGVYLQ